MDRAELMAELASIVEVLTGSDEEDLGLCPYFLRGAPGADPDGVCDSGCMDEPACQTCCPSDGWVLGPNGRAERALAAYRVLT